MRRSTGSALFLTGILIAAPARGSAQRQLEPIGPGCTPGVTGDLWFITSGEGTR